MATEDKDDDLYRVVINHEEQYSIWPLDKENAPGWKDAGKTGTKTECLAYIKEAWTDMRPKSLRDKMDRDKGRPSALVRTRFAVSSCSSQGRRVPRPAPL